MGLMKITPEEMKEWRKEVTRGHVNPSHMRRLLAVYEATEKKNAKLLALVAALDERRSAEEEFAQIFSTRLRCGRLLGVFSSFGRISNAKKKEAEARRRALEES